MSSNTERFGLPPSSNEINIVRDAVKEIVEASKKYLDKPIKSITVLDVGSGHGEYSKEMSKHFGKVTGVEPFREAYLNAVKITPKNKNLQFINSKIEDFRPNSKYDLIVHLTVFEHMSDPKKGFDRIFQLLNKGGIIYLTAPNKYWLFEQHYGLPFLSWVPLPIANLYLKFTKDVNSYEDCSYSQSYNGMRSFFDKYDCTYEFVLPFDANSSYIGCGNNRPLFSLVKKLGISLIRANSFFWNFSKGFIMVIRKNN